MDKNEKDADYEAHLRNAERGMEKLREFRS